MKTNNKVIVIFFLFVFSFIIRAIFFKYVRGIDVPLMYDENAYNEIAYFLAQGNDLPTTGRPLLTPLILTPIYYLFGPDVEMARWLMIAISSFAAPVLFLFVNILLDGNSLLEKRKQYIGFFAGVFWCLYPSSIFYSSWILTENLAVLLLIISAYLFFLLMKNGNIWIAILTGLCFGACTLNRSSFLLLPLFLLVSYLIFNFLNKIQPKLSFRHWIFFLLGVILSFTPVTLINYTYHGVFMPVETRLGGGLYLCNSDLNHKEIQAGLYYKRPMLSNYLLSITGKEYMTPIEENVLMKRLAIEEIRKNWKLLPKPLFNRAKNFWSFRPNPRNPNFTKNDFVMLFIWVPILFLSFFSFRYWSWRNDWPMLMIILYTFIMILPFWGTPRFRYPVDAFIVLRATICIAFIYEQFINKKYFKT